jgi:hypothetical protein
MSQVLNKKDPDLTCGIGRVNVRIDIMVASMAPNMRRCIIIRHAFGL